MKSPLSLGCALLGVLAWLFSLPALAADEVSVYQQQPRSYVSGGIGQVTMTFDDYEVKLPILSVGATAMVNDYVGVGFRLARSVARDEYHHTAFSLDHLATAYATVKVPVWKFFYAQVYAGVADAKMKTAGPSPRRDTERNDDTSISYGLDLGIKATPRINMALGYSHYIDESYWEVSSIEGRLQYLF